MTSAPPSAFAGENIFTRFLNDHLLKHLNHLPALALLALTACVSQPAPPGSIDLATALTFEARRDDVVTSIEADWQTHWVDVTSPFGIGRGVLKRQSADWPSDIRIRLRVLGLEQLIVEAEAAKYSWAVSHGPERQTRMNRLGSEGSEPVDPTDADWSPAKTVLEAEAEDGSVAYFEIRLPERLFAGNPEEIRLQWVDFFRT